MSYPKSILVGVGPGVGEDLRPRGARFGAGLAMKRLRASLSRQIRAIIESKERSGEQKMTSLTF